MYISYLTTFIYLYIIKVLIYNMFGKNTRKCMVRENTYIISDKLVKIIE